MTGFYGFPNHAHHHNSWDLLRRLSFVSSQPWCVLGDFNDSLSVFDKRGGAPQPSWLIDGFRSAVVDAHLTDLPQHGSDFTWERGKGY